MNVSKKRQKRICIMQSVLAAATIIWLVFSATVIPFGIGGETGVFWMLLIVPVCFALPCVPFLVMNFVMGQSSSKGKEYSALGCVKKCIIKLILTLAPSGWILFWVLGHLPTISAVALRYGYLYSFCAIIVFSCMLFIFEMVYANTINREKRAEQNHNEI